jgi:hypothetical protein
MPEAYFQTASDDTAAVTSFPAVHNLRCRVKKITTTDEGAVGIAIELQIEDDRQLEQVRDLIRVQQSEVTITISGVQGQLPL